MKLQRVAGFWLSKYEVNQTEYFALLGNNPSGVRGASLPVENVTWFNAVNYCARLTEREAAAGRLPAGYVYRLPTEAEWEYASRAGTTTRFSFGDDPGYPQLHAYGWSRSNSGNSTRPVGTKLPNPWGLYDMQGNVFEWCLDWLGSYPGGRVTDYKGPASGVFRVLRGGSAYNSVTFCRSAFRGLQRPEGTNYDEGFRVALGRPAP